MKKLKSTFKFFFSVLLMFLAGATGGGYACAADASDGGSVQDLGDGGKVVGGESSVTKNEKQGRTARPGAIHRNLAEKAPTDLGGGGNGGGEEKVEDPTLQRYKDMKRRI